MESNIGGSMNGKQKLELTWIGKDKDIKLEPRILIEDSEKSHGDENSENMLIHGDNLLALKALEQEFAGKIKCVYIDPPYNTGSAFEHYDDNVEHSIWLSLMRPRLELFKNLLSDEGSIWISIDDNEQAYLKILCDEIFGRRNFLADVIWNSTKSVTNTAIISTAHTHNLVYFKDKEYWIKNRTEFRIPEDGEGFSNPDNDLRGPWKADPFQVGGWRPNQQYEIINPKTGKVYKPNKGCSWKNEYKKYQELLADNRIVFGKNGDGGPQRKRFLSEATERGKVITTLWTDLDTTTNGTQHSKKLFGDEKSFTNPKPEGLIQRILELSSRPGDIILDSFLGSGTTAATAHKLGRKWIGIELGEHAYTHCLPRMKQVVDGLDKGGITQSINWQGGGGFRFFELAPSLLKKDNFGKWIIDEQYNANMLAAAMCKHEGFKFSPDEQLYWKQGRSTESDYIFTTTAFVTVEQLDKIKEEMRDGESVLVCAKAFAPECINRHADITVKKIPQMILGRCEFGQDNYDLNIIKATEEEADDEFGGEDE